MNQNLALESMGLLETQLLVGMFLSVVAIGISAFYLYSSWKKNTGLTIPLRFNFSASISFPVVLALTMVFGVAHLIS